MTLQSVVAGALASVFVTSFMVGAAFADVRIVNDTAVAEGGADSTS